MTKALTSIGILILVLFIVFLIVSRNNLYDKTSVLKGQLIEAENEVDGLEKQAVALITAHKNRIKEYEEVIAKKEAVIEQIEETQIEKDKTIAALESEFAQLEDKDAMIVNLQSQVNVWKEKFNLAQEEITGLREINFNLTEKYKAQVAITEEYKGLWEREKSINDVQGQLMRRLEIKAWKSGLHSKITTSIAIVAGGFITYQLIRGQND